MKKNHKERIKKAEKLLQKKHYRKNFLKEPFHEKINLLIIGAGIGGQLVLREVKKDKRYKILGFVDDDIKIIGKKIHGIKIYGPISNIQKVLRELKDKGKVISEVIIAMPSAEGSVIKQIMKLLFQKVAKISILPTEYENPLSIKTGVALPKKIRRLKIEDFFRRKPILLPFKEILSHYRGKKILITGVGSIGSELVKQLILFSPEQLILLDNSEQSLYTIQTEPSNEKDNVKKTFLLADLRDKEKIKKIISKFKPEIIFHTAAYKHVPLLEDNPEESINNNILSFCNLLSSIDNNTKEFILISTDKAVDPSSIMGISKRICELILQLKSKEINSKLLSVRFGNVACSSGSVIPLFEKQIERRVPVTVTDKKMKRFFMTIPEATQLVLQTPILGETGNILVLDMGEQYSLLELAKDMIMLEGFIPYKDIPIKIIGTRKGEKTEEKLTGELEKIEKTKNQRIFVVKTNQVGKEKINKLLLKFFNLSKNFDQENIREKIQREFNEFGTS